MGENRVRLFDFDPHRLARWVREIDKLKRGSYETTTLPQSASGGRLGKGGTV